MLFIQIISYIFITTMITINNIIIITVITVVTTVVTAILAFLNISCHCQSRKSTLFLTTKSGSVSQSSSSCTAGAADTFFPAWDFHMALDSPDFLHCSTNWNHGKESKHQHEHLFQLELLPLTSDDFLAYLLSKQR